MKFIFPLCVISMLTGCSKEEIIPIPEYEIIPIVEVTSPLFGHSNIVEVMAHIYVVINEMDTVKSTRFYDVGGICATVWFPGQPVDYTYPAFLEMWTELKFRLEGENYYHYIMTDDMSFLRAYIDVRLMFQVMEKGLGGDRISYISTLINTPIEHFSWEVENIFVN